MGTVTDVFGPASDDYATKRPFKYDLDDGTGVIKVCFLSEPKTLLVLPTLSPWNLPCF